MVAEKHFGALVALYSVEGQEGLLVKAINEISVVAKGVGFNSC